MSQASTTARYSALRETTPPPAPARPPYAWAVLAGVLVFVLYAVTLAPTTAFWDTSEYIATAHILGIPHPPGNPLFVIMARAWELLLSPTALSTAVRVNLFSALMGAATVTCWYLVVHRILAFFTESEVVRRVGAGAAVLLSATAFTVWNQSNVNEKVYTVSLFTIALLSWVAFLWRDHVEEHRASGYGAGTVEKSGRFHDDNALVFMAFVLALSVGNHLMAFLAAPALFVLFLLVKPRVLTNWKLYLWSIFFAVLGLSVNLFLPIRAGLKPVIDEADPTCPSMTGAFGSILSFGKAGCANLAASLAREQYAKPPVSDRLAPFWAQLLNYLQYFDWQWARSLDGAHGYFAPARLPFTLLFAALGLYGAYRHFQKDRTSFWYVLTLFLTLSLALIFYLNFKYGFGQAQAWGMPMESAEVRERDYFFLVSFSIWGLWAGVGITALWLGIAETAGGVTRKHLLRGSPVLVLAFAPLVLNWSYASRAGDYAARDWAYNLLMSVEPYGVLFTNGDNDTFPLWYLQEVEGIRKDVTVLVWSYLNTPWYVKQMRQLTTPCETPGEADRDPTRNLCQRVYHAPPGADVYPDAHYPTKSILDYTDAQIDQITGVGYIQLGQNVTFEDRGVQTEYAAGTVLPAANQFILAIIKRAWGDRPIYFASTTNAHRQLGLAKYTPRQGVAFKLMTPDELKQPGIVAMSPQDPYTAIYGDYVDVPRTQKLISEVFRYRDLVHRPHWVDDATRGIPTYYGYAYMALAQARQQLGTAQKLVQQDVDRAEAWLALSNR